MSDWKLIEPTSAQCSEGAIVYEHEDYIVRAIWYPQMGGYVAKALVQFSKETDCCFDAYIWHDGEFPFSEDGDDKRSPAHVHHCMASQFINFGETITGWMDAYTPVANTNDKC